jgi:hypothetical protein
MLLLSGMVLLAACNKYAGVNNQQISGRLYIHDTLSSRDPVPASLEPLYLNNTGNANSYVFQTKTDSVGYFNITYPGTETITLFSRFIINGAEFRGQSSFTNLSGVVQKNVDIYPLFTNALSVSFYDSNNGLIPNLPFRIYTSQVMALADSTNFATVNSKSDSYGQFGQYNLNPVTYYIVAKDTIGGKPLSIFDSVTVGKKGVYTTKAYLK